MANGTISNKELYQTINSLRLELKGDITAAMGTLSQQQGELNQRFEQLEAGRITRLETKLANINGKLAMFGLFVVAVQIFISLYLGK